MPNTSSIVESLEGNPAFFANTMKELIEHDPAAFCNQVLPLLPKMPAERARHLLWMLSLSKGVVQILCDPSLLSENDACTLAERLNKVDPHFETNLFKEVFGQDGSAGLSLSHPAYGLRFLALASAKGRNIRLLSFLRPLLGHPDSKIRSKAVALIGKLSHDFQWLQKTRREEDDRVRANALEALWQPGIPEHFRALLWDSVQDRSNRVVGNALLGLYRQGDSGCIPAISSMALHPDERYQATAAWVMGESGDDRFRSDLIALRDSTSSLVQQNVTRALEKIDTRTAPKLERMLMVMLSKAEDTMPFRTAKFHSDSPQAEARSDLVNAQLFRVALVSQLGSPVSTLLPTDFQIIRNSALVKTYTVETETPAEMLSIAFVVPGTNTMEPNHVVNWRNFFEHFFKQKRHLDYWAILKYAPAPASSRPGKQDNSGIKPTFVRNSLELENFFKSQAGETSATPLPPMLESLFSIATSVRRGLPHSRHAFHIIVVESPDIQLPDPQQLETLKQAAIENNITIHVLSTNLSSTLAQLAEPTGGASVVSHRGMESLQRDLFRIYACLFSIYRIRCEATPSDREPGAEITIRARNDRFVGELQTNSPAPDQRASEVQQL